MGRQELLRPSPTELRTRLRANPRRASKFFQSEPKKMPFCISSEILLSHGPEMFVIIPPTSFGVKKNLLASC
jgi:hypothetical protein